MKRKTEDASSDSLEEACLLGGNKYGGQPGFDWILMFRGVTRPDEWDWVMVTFFWGVVFMGIDDQCR